MTGGTFIRLPGTEGVANSGKNRGLQVNRMLAKAAQGLNELGIGLEKCNRTHLG